MCKAWEGFTTGAWQSRIDVRDFIQKNYTPYGGDEAFLAPATPRTQALMHKLQGLMKLEQEFGVRHLPSDFKKQNGYLRSLQLSEEYGLYRQDYCGCEFSAKARGIGTTAGE